MSQVTEVRVIDGIVKRMRDGKPLPKPYCVRYRKHPRANPSRQSFRTLEEAKRFQTDTKASVLTGHFIDPSERMLTVAEYIDRWAAAKPWSGATRKRRESIIRRHIKPTFGTMLLADVDRIDVQTWVNGMEAAYSAKTIELHYDVLNSMFNDAVFERKLNHTPCQRITRPEVDRQVGAVLAPTDVVALAENIGERYALMVWLGAMAGLRVGEVLGLGPEHITTVNVDGIVKGTIKVERQWSPSGFITPKTKMSNRTIPVPVALVNRITAHVAAHGLSSEGTLFSNADGGALSHQRFYTHVWPAAIKGLALHDECDTFHALRHHYASTLIDAGLNAKIVQTRLGHGTIQVTYDVYGHLFETADDATRDAFEGRYDTTLRVAS